MHRSIFNNVYIYREREGGNSRENFLIELFAFSLNNSNDLFNDFIYKLGIEPHNLNNVVIRTQEIYPEGRPDIEIILGNHHILVECKVDSFEGNNQLNRYLNILENRSSSKNKHLLFLTKRYESREQKRDSKINIHCLQWSNIYKIIPNEPITSVIYQFKKYLKEQNMGDKNFNLNDITSMLIMPDTISKMDEVLDRVKSQLPVGFGDISKSSSRRTQMTESWFGNYRHFKDYHLWWGFNWSDEDCKVPELFVQIKSSSNDSKSTSESTLKQIIIETNFQDYSDDNKGINAWNTISMIEFMKNDNDNIQEMASWLLNAIETLYKYKPNL